MADLRPRAREHQRRREAERAALKAERERTGHGYAVLPDTTERARDEESVTIVRTETTEVPAADREPDEETTALPQATPTRTTRRRTSTTRQRTNKT